LSVFSSCAYTTSTGDLVWNSPNVGSPALAAEAGGVLYLDSGDVLNASTGDITFLWSGRAQSIVVGNGRIGAVTDPRVLDLYGLPGS
jgi:outer membrane protein assembly factor BamB